MDSGMVLLQISSWILLSLLSSRACPVSALQVVLTRTPPLLTNARSASFAFHFENEDGVIACRDCAVLCKLDSDPFNACLQDAAYTDVSDGSHTFEVLVHTSVGSQASKRFIWAVYSEVPTASIDAGPTFTNAANLTVKILLSTPCTGGRGFKCENESTCDLRVTGAGMVLPSTLKSYPGGLEYSVVVILPTEIPIGRITLALGKGFCMDGVKNFKRGPKSTVTVHFDRRPVTVNLWTAIPETQVHISNFSRTIQATNKVTGLIIYLDFTQPVRNSSTDLVKVLKPSTGVLKPIHRKSHGNRQFGFLLTNVTSVAVVTISIIPSRIISRAGTVVTPPSAVTFLYDSVRPGVQLTSLSHAKTRNRNVFVLIKFAKPVFSFGSQAITISDGKLTSFEGISRSIYLLHVLADEQKVVTIFVPENKTADIAGNPNLPSNVIRVRHYSIPAASIALYSFTTASLLATSFAAAILSLSSATLAAAGALTAGTMSSIFADPSRNLLGMAGHLQVFAFSEWLAVSLPIEYYETARGLQWLIPHAGLPWEGQRIQQTDYAFQRKLQPIYYKKQDRTDNDDCTMAVRNYKCIDVHDEPVQQLFWRGQPEAALENKSIYDFTAPVKGNTSFLAMDNIQLGRVELNTSKLVKQARRRLGVNSTIFGRPLTAAEYRWFFETESSDLSVPGILDSNTYTGWHDFKMNIFWLGAIGGALSLLHFCTKAFLKWRTRTSLDGALSIPRFELFLIIFALPGFCQALAFIIRGGTTGGIIVGVILFAVPAAFLLSVLVFLSIAIFFGKLVQYNEIRWQQDTATLLKRVLIGIMGSDSVGKWIRKEGLSSTFLPSFGLLFGDRKGPPKLVILDGTKQRSLPRWIDSGLNGIGRMKPMNSDEESDEAVVSRAEKFIGVGRAGYVMVDLGRRVTVGIVFGVYPRSDVSWSQVSILFGYTVGQLLYLMIFKPYIRRGVQIVESISLLCEAVLFCIVLALLVAAHPVDSHEGIGIVMLALLLVCLTVQLVNEWYALMNQLLRLSPSQEPSLKLGFKMLCRGLLLPLLPQDRWARFITPQPSQAKVGLVPVVHTSPEIDLKKSSSIPQDDPDLATTSESVVPAYGPGSPCFIDPRTVCAGAVTGEITAESMPIQVPPWSSSRTMEGKRSRGGMKLDVKSTELKTLRELAKASFPRGSPIDESTVDEEAAAAAAKSGGYLVAEQQLPTASRAQISSAEDDSSSEDDCLNLGMPPPPPTLREEASPF